MKCADYKTGEKVTLYCLLGNLLLSVFKGAAGFFGGSRAMVADAFHSGSDVMATLVVYLCLKIAKKPADDCHMYGHGKVEPLAAATVGIIMFITAALIVKDAIASLVERDFVSPSLLALAAAVISIVLKEFMFRVTYRAGRDINSESILANAWEHRSDAYSSIGTFVGISGSMLGGHFNLAWLAYFDSLAAIFVAALIFKLAARVVLKAVRGLMDASPAPEKVSEIRKIVEAVEGVKAVAWIKGRAMGRQIFVDLAVQVDGSKTVEEGHQISSSIKQEVMSSMGEVGNVLVHIDPHR